MRTIEDALEVLNTLNSQGRIEYAAYSELYDTIAMIETEPVKHGHWIKSEKSDYEWECSACGYGLSDYRTTYCYDCGAKMEVEE